MKKRFFCFFLLFLNFSFAFASETINFSDDLSVSIDTKDTFVGGKVVYTFQDNENLIQDIKTPSNTTQYEVQNIGNFSNTQISFINGSMQKISEKGTRYQVYLKQEGKLTIPSFKIVTDNQIYETKPLEITVGPMPQNQNNNASNANSLFANFFANTPFASGFTPSRQEVRPRAWLEFAYDDNVFYQNKRFQVEVRLYTNNKDLISNASLKETYPLKGGEISLYDISMYQKDKGIVSESRNDGQVYYKVIKTYMGFPIGVGLLYFHPLEYVLMYPGSNRYIPLQLKGKSIDVKVLGNEKTLSYVGDTLSIENAILEENPIQDKVVNLKITFIGDGNVSIFRYPLSDVKVDNLRISPPTDKVTLFAKNGKIYLKNEVTYSLVPKLTGNYTVPSKVYHTYDLRGEKKDYQIPAISFEVAAKKADLSKIDLPKKEIKDNVFSYLFFNPFLIGFLIFILLTFIGIFIYHMYHLKLSTDKDFYVKTIRSRKLQKNIKKMFFYYNKKDVRNFYLAMQKSLFTFLIAKYSLKEEYSFNQMIEKLKEKNVDDNFVEEVKSLYFAISYYSYSGDTKIPDIQSDLKKFQSLLKVK